MQDEGLLMDEEAARVEAELEATVAGMEARELSKRLAFPPHMAPPTPSSIKRWLKHEKVELYKPLAIDMGMTPTAVYPNLYQTETVPDVLFNGQGVMVDEPVCAKCNDAGLMREPVHGWGAWVYRVIRCPSCNPKEGE